MIEMEFITLEWLKGKNAYDEAVEIFENEFGKKATIKQVIDYLHKINKPHFEVWLMTQEAEITIAMINNGANIHVLDDYLLRWAVTCNYFDLVKFLVEKGADIHAENDCALRWAANYGRLDLVKVLVEKGADIHAKNDSALRWAAENGHLNVVKVLRDTRRKKLINI